MAFFSKTDKVRWHILTFLWGNNSFVVFPGERFSFIEKTNNYKKVLFAQGLFFRSSELNYQKRVYIFLCKCPIWIFLNHTIIVKK